MNETLIQILLVEDNPVDARMVEIMLSGVITGPGLPGFSVHKAPTMARALSMLQQSDFDVVLLDLSLPDSFGLETLHKLKASAFDLPIIILSGLNDEAVALQAVNEGAQDYLVKGQGDEMLLARSIRYALERQQAEAALQASEHRFRALIENSTEALVLLGADGKSLYRSPTAARLMKLDSDTPLSEDPFSRVHPEDIPRANSLFRNLLSSPGEIVQAEVRVLRHDGVWRWFEAVGSNMLSEPGIEAIVVNYRDVTERKEREREMEAIATLSADLRRAHGRSDTLRLILDFVMELVSARGCAFGMDTGQGEILLEMGVGHISSETGTRVPKERSLSGMVLASFEPVISTDLSADQRYAELTHHNYLHTGPTICLPLIAQEQPIGVLWVARDIPFEDADILLLGTIADIAASAIYRISLLEQTRQRSQRLLAMHEIDLAVAAQAPLEWTLEIILKQTVGQINVEAAAVFVYDPTQDDPLVAESKGFQAEVSELCASGLNSKQVDQAVQNWNEFQTPQIIELKPETHQNAELLRREGFVSFCAAPLFARREVIGVLEVYQRSLRNLGAEEIEFLESLAAQASIAAENARLHGETQRLLEQTQRQARQLQKIMESVPDGIVLINDEHNVVVANPSGREYLRLLTGGPVANGDPVTQVAGYPLDAILEGTRKNGTGREVALTKPYPCRFEIDAHPLQEDSNREHWVLALRDITQKRELQERVQQHEQLATVGQLAAGIAHDFNNIIGAILLQTHLLAKSVGLEPQNQKRLDMISQQSQYAANLVRQILDFSRQSMMERTSLNLRPLIAEQVKLLQRTLPATIQIEFTALQPEYWANVDATRIQQILMNLALNAKDAMPEGGTLRISLEDVSISAGEPLALEGLTPGSWLCLAVSDTGVGIPAEIRHKIFDPFFTTKEPDKGTGLGLSQVYGIVKQHEGEITVEAGSEGGSTFVIYLPATSDSLKIQSLEWSTPEASADAETILIVEDNEPLRDALKSMLEDLGYQILVAANGREAFDIFTSAPRVDLVLSDLVMPEMGGVELFSALRGIRPEVKMIIISGYPLETKGRELLQEGIVDWIQKPFTVADLAGKVRSSLKVPKTLAGRWA